MFRNYFKIAFRNLIRHKTFSAINIFGLSIGLTCCLLIMLYLQNELNYDQFHEKSNRIVRVTMEYAGEGNITTTSSTGTKVAPQFKRVFPEVESGVRMYITERSVKAGNNIFTEPRVAFADSTFFDIFSFKLLSGNPKKVLNAPDQIVITEMTAKKYFGNDNPIGKVLKINGRKDFQITGVVQNCPENSQIKFDLLASFSSISAVHQEETWWNANYITYLLLKNENSIQTLSPKIFPYMKTQEKDLGKFDAKNFLTYHLEPFVKVHLYSNLDGFEPNNSIVYIYFLSGIALLILLIACINYMNLTTAKSSERVKEVGIRKVMGAEKLQLFYQFIGESVLITSFSMAISLMMAYILLPFFNQLADRNLSFSLLNKSTILVFIGIAVMVSLLSGSYPALILSGFQPIKALKGAFKTSSSGVLLRKTLIISQFVISICLVICMIVVQNQLNFIQNRKLGYDKEHVLVLPVDSKVLEKVFTFKSEFKQNPDIKNVSVAYEPPSFINGGYSMQKSGSDAPNMSVAALPADEDIIKTMNFEIIAGSDLTNADMQTIGNEDNKKNNYHFILNESAARELGWKPEEAIGKRMNLGEGRPGEVKAVIKDFHFQSMHQAIKPLVIFPDTYGRVMLVKISGKNIPQTIHFLETRWKSLAPHRPFTYSFLEEEFNKLYSTETRIGLIFRVFSGLAISLACLGLLGLAMFVTAQRTKEIGIRKVLGASVTQIVTLLSGDFIFLVGIAFLIAVPLAWYAMNKWLQDFAYRINISWWTFALAGFLALMIALLTVSFQAIKAALANPVKSLRSE